MDLSGKYTSNIRSPACHLRRTSSSDSRCFRSPICVTVGLPRHTSLAVTAGRGRDELAAARSGDSKTTWPEAHYLAPLHPVLEWASDRALAELSRRNLVARGRWTIRRCWCR